MGSEVVNQYTTLLGWSLGWHENDPTARYLLSINPVGETIVVFAIPIFLISVAYLAGMKWVPLGRWTKRLRNLIVGTCLFLLVLLAINTTGAATSDFITLHEHHIV
jgi:drug/metabolite transporter (DMT)-like permease